MHSPILDTKFNTSRLVHGSKSQNSTTRFKANWNPACQELQVKKVFAKIECNTGWGVALAKFWES